MKTLIVMRHGRYTSLPTEDKNNFEFVLTEQGKQEIAEVSVKLSEGFNIDELYYSPVTRTAETAEIVGKVNNVGKNTATPLLMDICDHGDYFAVFDALDDNKDTICLVTHEPNICAFAEQFLNNRDRETYYKSKELDCKKSHREALVLSFNVESWSEVKDSTNCEFSVVDKTTEMKKKSELTQSFNKDKRIKSKSARIFPVIYPAAHVHA